MKKESSSLELTVDVAGCLLLPVALIGTLALATYVPLKIVDGIGYLATGKTPCGWLADARGIDYSVSHTLDGTVVSVDRREIPYSDCGADGCIAKLLPYEYMTVAGKTGRQYHFASTSGEVKSGRVLITFNPTLRGYALESTLLIHARSYENYCVDEFNLHLARDTVHVPLDGVLVRDAQK